MSAGEPSPARSVDESLKRTDWSNPRVASILAAAAKCFAQDGFTATTLASIGRELGLRKSIVHYYFASKLALIHEVQAFTYERDLGKLKDGIPPRGSSVRAAADVLRSVWQVAKQNPLSTALNIEVWSAARRDADLRRGSAKMKMERRTLLAERISAMASPSTRAKSVEISTLLLAAVDGLLLAEFLEGAGAPVDEAFDIFLQLVGVDAPADAVTPPLG
jgi:AcrR family transcriptional regulator